MLDKRAFRISISLFVLIPLSMALTYVSLNIGIEAGNYASAIISHGLKNADGGQLAFGSLLGITLVVATIVFLTRERQ